MLVQSQKGVVHLGLLVLLLLGLVAGVYLVQHPQIFKSKATGDLIWLVDENGNPVAEDEQGNPVVETQQIRIKIELPTSWNSQGFIPNLAKSVYGQEEDQGSPQCLDQGTWRGGTCINANYYKKDGTFVRDGNEPGCYACPQQQTPIPTQLPTKPSQDNLNLNSTTKQGSTCQSLGGKCGRSDKYIRSEGFTCSNGTYQGYNDGSKFSDCDTTVGEYPYCWTGCERVTSDDVPTDGRRGAPEVPIQPAIETQPPAQAPQETTQSVRISLNQASAQKDGVCSESSDSTQTCKEISVLDLSAKGNIIDWQLPSQEGIYSIYVGFISSKGNYKETSLTVGYKTSISTIPDEKKNDGEGGFLRLFSFQKGKSGETKIKGKLVIVHGDNLHTKQSFRSFAVRYVDQDGVPHYYNLKFKESDIRLPQSGDDIEVGGSLEGQTFNVNRVLTQVITPATISTEENTAYVVYPQTLAASGGKKALITYVRWSDNNQQYFSSDLLKDTILDNGNYYVNSSKFLKEASFDNNLHITQLDFSPTEITVPISGMTCAPLGFGLANILTSIDAASKKLSGYDIYIYLLAGPNNCDFLGAVPLAPPVRIFMNNYFDPQIYSNMREQKRREFFSETIAHEVGHTFGLQHANRIDCKNNGNPVPISRSCQIVEYGDPSTVMGNHYTFFGATQDFYLGWLPQIDIEKLTYSSKTTVYEKTIAAVESSMPDRGAKLLIVQGPLSGLSFLPFTDLRSPLRSAYYVSFRKKTASVFTQNPYPMLDDFYQGATIQTGLDNSSGIPDQVWLINTSAGQQGSYTLKNGKNFYDPEQRILIEQLRKDDDTVTVRVTYNSDPP